MKKILLIISLFLLVPNYSIAADTAAPKPNASPSTWLNWFKKSSLPIKNRISRAEQYVKSKWRCMVRGECSKRQRNALRTLAAAITTAMVAIGGKVFKDWSDKRASADPAKRAADTAKRAADTAEAAAARADLAADPAARADLAAKSKMAGDEFSTTSIPYADKARSEATSARVHATNARKFAKLAREAADLGSSDLAIKSRGHADESAKFAIAAAERAENAAKLAGAAEYASDSEGESDF